MSTWNLHEPRQTSSYSTRASSNYDYDPSASVPKTKITLAGPDEVTLLHGVWCRARDAASSSPLLGDRYAQLILDHCDVDYTRGSLAYLHDERWARLGAGRAKALDDWCQAFLDEAGNEPVQVLQIACGLDSRVLRIRRGPNVRWIDLDRPIVVNLRERIYSAARWDPQQDTGTGEYILRNLSVVSDRWLRDIPQDRRTLVIIEGLLYHLSPTHARKIIRDVVEHFGGPETKEEGTPDDYSYDNDREGYHDEKKRCRPRESSSHGQGKTKRCELVFDVLGTLIRKRSAHVEWLRPTGVKVMSGYDSPHDILKFHPRLRLLENIPWDQVMRMERKAASAPPWFGSKGTMLAALLPSFWDFFHVMRFQF